MLLELRHAARHDPHAALDGAALGGSKFPGDADHAVRVRYQLLLLLGARRGQQRAQLPRERRHVGAAGDDLDEAFRKRPLLGRRKRRLVLYGVRDATECVHVTHDVAQRAGELRDVEGEGTGDALQDLRLVGEVAVRRFLPR